MDYIYIDVDTTSELIKNVKSLNDIKILFYIIEKMNDNSYEILINNSQISKGLKIDKSIVSKSIKNLIEKEILLINNKNKETYILNEKYFKYGR
ncbi:hypothetical protein ACV3QH_17435 [Clostridium perfringens]